MIAIRHLLAITAALAATRCDGGCGLDLERMIEQPRFTSYEACTICPGGTIMLQPPAGTVARDQLLGDDALMRGRTGTAYVETFPIELDRRVLARGKNRFDVFCAACHGRLANGLSQVAENMSLRPPPNLLAEPYTTYPPGRIYAVVNEGFGLMRSYAAELTVADRWAVVAYLQALQLAQDVPLDQLPEQIRREAEPWLR